MTFLCNVRREGRASLVIGGSSLVVLEGRRVIPCNFRREGGASLVIGGLSLVALEGKACNPL